MELQAANLRLRGVVADMRREMESFRDPSFSANPGGTAGGGGGAGGARERRLEADNEDLRYAHLSFAIFLCRAGRCVLDVRQERLGSRALSA